MFRRTQKPGGSRQLALSSPPVDFRDLLEGSLDMIWVAKVKASDHRYHYASPSTLEILGRSPEEMLHLTPADIYTVEGQNVIASKMDAIREGHDTATITVEAIRPDGGHIWLENKIRLLHRGRDGELTIAVYLREITDRKRLEEKLASLAFLDGLTSIENRRAFDQALAREWKRTVRTGSLLSLLLVDVDHFKNYNDSYGHVAGDECLRNIAQAIRATVHRPSDLVTRYGGEEFAILLPDTGGNGATEVGGRLCQSIAALKLPHVTNDERGIVTVSVGVCTASGHVHHIGMPQGLIQGADTALYQAKRAGRNRVHHALPGVVVENPL